MCIDTLRGPGSVRWSAKRAGAVAWLQAIEWPKRRSAAMMTAIVMLGSAILLTSCMVGPTLYRNPSTGQLVPCGGTRIPMDATTASLCSAAHAPMGWWVRQPVVASNVRPPPQVYAVVLPSPSRPGSVASVAAAPPRSAIETLPVAARPQPATLAPRMRDLEPPPSEDPERVRFVQAHMRLLGYSVPRDDGVLDEETRTAIRAFQKRVGMTPDGRLSQRLHDQLQAEFNLCIVVRSMAAEPRSIDQHCGAATK